MLATVVVLNADCGPWASQRWFQTLREAANQANSELLTSDPLVRPLLQDIAEENAGGDVWQETLATEEQTLASISAGVDHKNERVAMSRWFHYVVSVRKFLQIRAKRLLISLYASLELGFFQHGRIADLVRLPAQRNKVGEDIGKSHTSEEQADIKRLRQRCSSALAFATSMLADQSVWRLNIAIYHVLSPLQKFHSWQNRLNRSCSESLE